ncbi:MAG: SOS response-associated peptidase [Chloroflexi bacterium]|nr:SOS response-associated peptidase [Chloroflexota bacterium]
MCGRFTMTYSDPQLLAEDLGVSQLALVDYRPRYNIAPTDMHYILRVKGEERQLLPARWGLINYWAKDAKSAFKQINARAEGIEKRPPFREAFEKRRCIVPADGFFEWTGPKNDRQPIWFHRPRGGLLYFAGLYESWQPKPDEWQRTFTIVTTRPNEIVEPIHDRMPVVFDERDADLWMFATTPQERLKALLVPAPAGSLVAEPVSKRVNSVENDDPRVLVPDPEPARLLP